MVFGRMVYVENSSGIRILYVSQWVNPKVDLKG